MTVPVLMDCWNTFYLPIKEPLLRALLFHDQSFSFFQCVLAFHCIIIDSISLEFYSLNVVDTHLLKVVAFFELNWCWMAKMSLDLRQPTKPCLFGCYVLRVKGKVNKLEEKKQIFVIWISLCCSSSCCNTKYSYWNKGLELISLN